MNTDNVPNPWELDSIDEDALTDQFIEDKRRQAFEDSLIAAYKNEDEYRHKIPIFKISQKNISNKEISALDLFNLELPEIEFLVEGYIPEQCITILGGDSSGGKTYFSLYTSLCLVQGRKVFGTINTKKCRVLYIDEENGIRVMKQRLTKLVKDKTGLENLNFAIFKGFTLDLDLDKIQFISIIEKYSPDLIIIDSLVRFLSGDENKAECMKEVFKILRDLKEEFKVGFLILHHTRKSNGYGKKTKDDLRGSGDIGAFGDVVNMLNKSKDTYFITQEKNRLHKERKGFTYIMEDNENGLIDFIETEYVKESKADKCVKYFIKYFEDNSIKGTLRRLELFEIALEGGFKDGTTNTAIKQMEDILLKRIEHGIYEVISKV